jgi:predicted nucleic acid-binding protein
VTACYLDASALVKLVSDEAESAAARAFVARHSARLTSRIAAVEVGRALLRKGSESVPLATDVANAAFSGVSIVELDAAIATRAASLSPTSLRSLDAIHLASALALGGELDEFVTYDLRLADAARAAGLNVIAPGQRDG